MPWGNETLEKQASWNLASPVLEEEFSPFGESTPAWEQPAVALLNESPYAQTFEWGLTLPVDAAASTPMSERLQTVEDAPPTRWPDQIKECAEHRRRPSEAIEEVGYAAERAEELGDSEAGNLPFFLELDALPEKLLRGTRSKSMGLKSLGDVVEHYLQSLKTPFRENNVSAAATLRYFTEACGTIGIRAVVGSGDLKVPAVVNDAGALVSKEALLVLWFSHFKAKGWGDRLPEACRGAGAPGALLYADLVEGRRLLTASGSWPDGLRPGTFLQLWENRAVFEAVRNPQNENMSGNMKFWGHSCIFRGFVDEEQTTILVADQIGLRRQCRWRDGTIHIWSDSRQTWLNVRMDFVIAASLCSVELIPGEAASQSQEWTESIDATEGEEPVASGEEQELELVAPFPDKYDSQADEEPLPDLVASRADRESAPADDAGALAHGEADLHASLDLALPESVERVLPAEDLGEYELAVLASSRARIDPNDTRIDVRAKFSLQRMLKRAETSPDATRLIEAINSGSLLGIYGDDLRAAVRVAGQHRTRRWLLVPNGEDAVLVLDTANPLTAPPTVVFRGDTPDISKQPVRLDVALQKVSKSLSLWKSGKIRRCESVNGTSTSGLFSRTPVLNIAPAGYCTAPSVAPATPPKIPHWVQPCLNKLLGTRLPLTGVLDGSTRNALQSFRGHLGLAEVELDDSETIADLDSATQMALQTMCSPPGATVQPKLSMFQMNWNKGADTLVFRKCAEWKAKQISAIGYPLGTLPRVGPAPYKTGFSIVTSIIHASNKCGGQPINEIHIFSHSGPYGLYAHIWPPHAGLYVHYAKLTQEEWDAGARRVDDLPFGDLAEDVVFYLYGCATARRCRVGEVSEQCEELGKPWNWEAGMSFAESLAQMLVNKGKLAAKVYAHPTGTGVLYNYDWVVFSRGGDGRLTSKAVPCVGEKCTPWRRDRPKVGLLCV